MALAIGVSNEKGGVGKTILSVELHQELQRKGYKTLLIDCDSQSNSTSFFGADNSLGTKTLVDMLFEDEPASNCIQHCKNGDIIAGDPELVHAETEIRRDGYEYDRLKDSIETILDDYDFIIMDTPRGYGIVFQNILVASDYIITPIETQGLYSLDGLVDFFIKVDKFAKKRNPELLNLGIVINLFRKNVKLHQRNFQRAREIAETANVMLFKNIIPMANVVSESVTEKHQPIYKYNRKSDAQTEIESFVNDVLKEIKRTPKGKDLKIRKNKE